MEKSLAFSHLPDSGCVAHPVQNSFSKGLSDKYSHANLLDEEWLRFPFFSDEGVVGQPKMKMLFLKDYISGTQDLK